MSGIRDAGIYVGSSRDIVVRNNEVYNNVAGIEIENSVGALIENNSAHHNTTGILVFALPNNPIKECSDTRVINNRVWANNHENFAKPGTTVSNLSPGVGIVVMAADRTEVTQNRITENDSYGIVVVSLAAARLPAKRTVDVEPNSDHTLIVANQYADNGRHPDAVFAKLLGAPGGDLFWDGSGQGNDWRESRALATFPKDLLGPASPASVQTPPVQAGSSAGGSK